MTVNRGEHRKDRNEDDSLKRGVLRCMTLSMIVFRLFVLQLEGALFTVKVVEDGLSPRAFAYGEARLYNGGLVQ